MKMKMKDYKNPIYEMYVAPYGFHFTRDGQNLGRILWAKDVNNITMEADEDNS